MSTLDRNRGDRRPPRVLARPTPSDWLDQDEIMTLEEVAAVFWPRGPLTVRSLRTAVRDGRLAVARIAGKIFTSPRAINEMTKCTPDKPGAARAARREDPEPRRPRSPARSRN